MLLPIEARTRTRLAPDARREEILEQARRLFGECGYATVSASEIARSAGITPSLVSHYFPGGKRDIFLTLVSELGEQVAETIHVDRTPPLRERVADTVDHWLLWLDANRETWLATAAQGDYIPDAELQAVVDTARDRSIDTVIADYADILTDDRHTRLMLRCWLGFNRACCRSWLNGTATRGETALMLTETLHQMLVTVRPALARLAAD